MIEARQNQADSLLPLKNLPIIPESGIIPPSNTFNGMAQIRLSGMPVRSEGETIIENYYLEKPNDIFRTACVAKIINNGGFARILYHPQYSERTIHDEIGTRVIKTTLATTLMIETTEGRWETVGHVCGVRDSELEGLGLELWKKDDYIVPEPKIEIPVYRKRPEPLNEWAEGQGIKPSVRLKIPSRKKRKGIRV